MPNTNKPRIHWALWLLGIVMLLAWQYWPQESASLHAPAAEHTPAPVELPAPSPAESPAHSRTNSQLPPFLPAEARTTIALIQRGGPFPHRQDGSVFGNREGHLPRQPRGWYHEYTVDAIAVIVYALSSVLHEAVGHGGACLAVGAVPHELSSMHLACRIAARAGSSPAAIRRRPGTTPATITTASVPSTQARAAEPCDE